MGRKMNIFRYRHFDIAQEHAAMKVGTDADLLGTLGEGGQRILDIGTGTGVLSLMYAQRYPDAQITAIEIDENAIIDATVNFKASPMGTRITLLHTSFQDFLKANNKGEMFDSVICNPPYFEKSTECPDNSRTRARHTSSLPFSVLTTGAYRMLRPDGVFSVCIPPEVLAQFCGECALAGFRMKAIYRIKSVPEKEAKRLVVIHKKGDVAEAIDETYCMRNADRSRSEWYRELMSDFLITSK